MKKPLYLAFFLAVVCGVCGVALAGVNAITAPIIESANAVTYTDGTYTGSANGFGGAVEVEVTIENGVITGLTYTADSETPSVGGVALPQLQEAILEAGNIDDVDTIGGATMSSNGMLDAIRNALNSASGTSVEDGTYSGEATGFGGKVTVDFTVSGGVVTEITIVGDGETASLGGAAITDITEQISSSGSLEFDAYSGATVTSTAIQEAIDAALGGN